MDLSVYQNTVNGGIKENINKIEDKIIAKANNLINTKKLKDKDIVAFYDWLDTYVEAEYKIAFGL